MTEHERLHEFAGAYALGALESEERLAFEGHLKTCDQCRAEVARFAPIPGLLSRAGQVPDTPLPPEVIGVAIGAVRDEWTRLRRSRRLWRLAAIAAVAFSVALSWATVRSSASEPDVVLAVDGGSVTGEVSLDSRLWGSALTLDLEGLPTRDGYVAWVVTDDGTQQQACSWGPTPTGRARLSGSASIPTTDVVRVIITDSDGAEVLATASG